MNLLNAVSSLDPRSFVGDLVQTAVKGLTGNESLGKAAGFVADLKTGNWLGAFARGSDALQGALQDMSAEAMLRWGPLAHVQLVGTAAEVATTCPGPEEKNSLEFGMSFGLIGWNAVFSWGGSGSACDGAAETSGSSGMRDILNDPTLSLEAKVALLFAELIDDLDERIEGKLGDLDAASRAQEADKGAGGDGEASANDFNRISTEVQMLMQKRSQMYGLQSNMMSMFNDVSMQIINNVR